MCETIRCRQQPAYTVLGLDICENCWIRLCDREEIETKKGTIKHDHGKLVIVK